MAKSRLSNNALFDTAEKLIEGYQLTADFGKAESKAHGKSGRKVYLVGRKLKSGNVSLQRYSFHDGKRERKSVGVLDIETDQTVKWKNKEKVRVQREICDKVELNHAGIKTGGGSRKRLSEYLDSDKGKKTVQMSATQRNRHALAKHVQAYGDVYLHEISKSWIVGFLGYLQKDAFSLIKKTEAKKLSSGTQKLMQTILFAALNEAYEKEMMDYNPVQQIRKRDRIHAVNSERMYLDEAELKRLQLTPCDGGRDGYDIKRFFMFAVCVGLRWSDLLRLRPCDLKRDGKGFYLDIVMKKTRQPLKVYLSDMAMELLPEVKDESTPYFRLPCLCTVNRMIGKWVEKAGIKKHITTHCARHTCATLLLNNGAPIQGVSAQLGHKHIRTTEIYAKITEDTKKQMSELSGSIMGRVLEEESNDGMKGGDHGQNL